MSQLNATTATYVVSASVLGFWLMSHDVPLIPVLAGIGICGAVMGRLRILIDRTERR